ncbi:hypothetical protein [Fulvivirga sedimenti]|uniref:Uncharacterized protein n=1 Tax=Fulvivirga sedimenti TaxID=2879465 RepID=A0A9X1L062_9BACT|nr:hypothetical protein [Fulvivirga sedimenti]MCA6075294.1 hypothetical protein [Fulvivirga sedimenti]MCA6076471.1 hypothetical protein [Fulvivirga sedimenti]MCA6077599.1 hypothetical protein [Fulvivirga sedimenti]
MRSLLLFLVVGLVAISSCDETKFISATRSTSISDSLVAVVLEAMPNEITGERILSTATNPEIAEFEERISDFDVDSLVFSISEYVGDMDIELRSNQLLLMDLDRNELLPAVNVPDISLYEFSEQGEDYILRFTDEESQVIADNFIADEGIIVQFHSYITGKPVSFRIKATMYLKVTGEIL